MWSSHVERFHKFCLNTQKDTLKFILRPVYFLLADNGKTAWNGRRITSFGTRRHEDGKQNITWEAEISIRKQKGFFLMQELTQVLWYFQHLAFWHCTWIMLLKSLLARLQSNPFNSCLIDYESLLLSIRCPKARGKHELFLPTGIRQKKELRLFPALPSVSLCSCIGFVSQYWPDEGQAFCSLVALDQTQLEQHPDKRSGTTAKNLLDSSAFTSYPIRLCWFHFQLWYRCCRLIRHGEAGL